MPVTLRIKPKQIEKTEGGTVNHGGRDLTADESPTGEVVKAGATFEAPLSWYKGRSHWHFLVVVDKSPAPKVMHSQEPPEELESVSTEVENKGGRTVEDWDDVPWDDFRGVVRNLGISSGGSRVAIMERLREAGYVKAEGDAKEG